MSSRERPDDRLVVKAITGVAGGSGIKTIAEFVETEKPCILKGSCVDHAQGFPVVTPQGIQR